jgi:hypothetical protein
MRCLVTLLLVSLLPVGGMVSSAPGRSLILSVISPPLAHSDSRVEEKLVRRLSRQSDIRVSLAEEGLPTGPPFPGDYHNTDSLLEWGREVGGRYLMVVEVIREGLERRKSFHVPLVFHKYETVGIIEGEFRFLDLSRGRLLAAEPFKVERKGPRIFQATMDDDANDPDLHLTAPDKVVFFDRLEESLCKHLAARVSSLAGAR